MSTRTRKEQCLETLEAAKEPLSLVALQEKLGDGFAHRTLRRWLSEWVATGFVERVGEGRSTKYVYLAHKKISEGSNSAPFNFSEDSQTIIDKVKRPLTERDPVTYQQDWLDGYIPNETFYLSTSDRDLLAVKGQRALMEETAGTYARKIYNRLLIDLSYHSSRLEGNSYSMLETKKLLLEGIVVDGKLAQDKIMLLNHKEAICFLVDNAPRLNTHSDTILTLHYLLSEGLVLNGEAGYVRQEGVLISKSTYVPLENPNRLSETLIKIAEKAEKITNPHEQSFFLLLHIAYLQAFIDVNKRTARLSANIPFVQNNLVPLSFSEIGKEDYLSAMIAIYEYQQAKPLIELFVHSYLRTCQQYEVTVEAMGIDQIRIIYRTQRRNVLRHIILQKLTGDAMEAYIQDRMQAEIPSAVQVDFYEDLKDDLRLINPIRIAGLGVSTEELLAWQGIHHDE
ncbi:MAG: hypothetical protein DHS20C10_06080 [marine bacterium B5-7]|nr:MAG: hypothetical protein DHS20C10_06080 [marine bacterium B5-7]